MNTTWKKTMIAIGIIMVGLFLLFFLQNSDKNLESGNTNNIQTDEELERYILDIRSYRAQMTVSIQSNKTTNRYQMLQEWEKDGIAKMTIEEPENKKGIEIEQNQGTITVKHTQLGLSHIYAQEEEMLGNQLWLNTFIEQYAQDTNRQMRQTEEEIIMEATIQSEHPYYQYTQLHIDKKTKKPTQLVVQDKDKNHRIYILYNEIEIYT